MSPETKGGREVPERDETEDLSPEAQAVEALLLKVASEVLLSSATVDLLLGVDADSSTERREIPEDAMRRARAVVSMSNVEPPIDVAAALRSRREEAGLDAVIGAAMLGIGEVALARIEEGAVQMLLNLDPVKVATYLGRVAIDPTVVVRAACQVNEEAVWGYTPGDHGHSRPQAARARGSAGFGAQDRAWIKAFVESWPRRASAGDGWEET